ncbi:MAG: BlaI/MecI/CopY family transcriptional regulator [Clostridia bacterium]|nr:BlaI/MecI/CopY family transcriptional regulator [Clostridia bacterium]
MSEIHLTNAERIIMEIIWNKGELSNNEIVELLSEDIEWSRHTVKTYTYSLSEKGLLGINQESPRKMKYYPILSKDEYLANATSNHLRDNYKNLSYMVAGLINNEKVTDKEIEELENLIKHYKEK